MPDQGGLPRDLSRIDEALSDLARHENTVLAAVLESTSGMHLAGVARNHQNFDLELLIAAEVDIIASAQRGLGRLYHSGEPMEVVVTFERIHQVLHVVPDQLGTDLVLALVLRGGRRDLAVARRRLRRFAQRFWGSP